MHDKGYRQIADDLRVAITSGKIAPGARLPYDTELAAHYGVSRDTARDAVNLLAGEGLVERRGRLGTYVREPVVLTFRASHADGRSLAHGGEADAWTKDVRLQGFEPDQIFSVRMAALTGHQAALLRLDEYPTGGGYHQAVLRRCVRLVNGKPSSVEDSYYPRWITMAVPELLNGVHVPGGTIRLLASRGHEQVGCLDWVSCRMPTPEEAATLDLKPGTPVLVTTRVGFTKKAAIRLSVEVANGETNRKEYEIGTIRRSAW